MDLLYRGGSAVLFTGLIDFIIASESDGICSAEKSISSASICSWCDLGIDSRAVEAIRSDAESP